MLFISNPVDVDKIHFNIDDIEHISYTRFLLPFRRSRNLVTTDTSANLAMKNSINEVSQKTLSGRKDIYNTKCYTMLP